MPERHDSPNDRREWFLSKRRVIPKGAFAQAMAQRKEMERVAALTPVQNPYWTPLGPSAMVYQGEKPNYSGRVTSLAVGPGGVRVYAGAANGGTWYSEDSGATWTPIDAYALPPQTAKGAVREADSLATGSIAVRFGDSRAGDTIYVGTGEPPSSPTDAVRGITDSYFGVGIKTSENGGASWTLEAKNLSSHGIFRLALDPDPKPQNQSADLVYAASSFGLFRRPTDGRPLDTWDAITLKTNADVVSDVIIAGRGNTKVGFAAIWGDAVYINVQLNNIGGVWAPVPGFKATDRVVLAASENIAGTYPTVYALCSSADGSTGALFRLDPGANAYQNALFQPVSGVPSNLFQTPGYPAQGTYDIVLAVDSSDPNTVYLGGAAHDNDLSLYKGKVSGSPGSFSLSTDFIGDGIHPDAHGLGFATNADGTHDASNVWVGCDGGVFQSTKSGQGGSFQARNVGISTAQVTYIAQHPRTDALLFGGTQDQGNLRFRGDQVCFVNPVGDAGGVAYDPNNGFRVMQQLPPFNSNTRLRAADDGGNSSSNWSTIAFPPSAHQGESAEFYAPLVAVAVDGVQTLAAFGTNRLWITSDWGGSWVTLPTFTNPYSSGGNAQQDILDGNITALTWASPQRVYAATERGGIWRFDKTGASWSKTPFSNSDLGVTQPVFHAIAVDNAAAGSFYAAVDSYLKYFDGSQWMQVQFPINITVNSLVVDPLHPDQVYAGCDVGVFLGQKNGTTWTWTVFGDGLPESAVSSLAIHPITRMLRAATYGLGVWEIPLDAVNAHGADLYLRINPADSGRISGGKRHVWPADMDDPTANGPGRKLTNAMSPDIKAVHSHPFFTPPAASDFLGFAALDDFATDLNEIKLLGTNRIFVEVHNRGDVPVSGDSVTVLLLRCDSPDPLPPLPADFAARIQNQDTTAWLLGSDWEFFDQTQPYRKLPGAVEARVPQVVAYDVDLSSANPPSSILAAAFVTTAVDPLTATETDMNTLVMSDKHVAMRKIDVGRDWIFVLEVVGAAVGLFLIGWYVDETIKTSLK